MGRKVIDKDNKDKDQSPEMVVSSSKCDNSEITLTQETDDFREYALPYGWKKVGKKRKLGKQVWYFCVFNPEGKKEGSYWQI